MAADQKVGPEAPSPEEAPKKKKPSVKEKNEADIADYFEHNPEVKELHFIFRKNGALDAAFSKRTHAEVRLKSVEDGRIETIKNPNW